MLGKTRFSAIILIAIGIIAAIPMGVFAQQRDQSIDFQQLSKLLLERVDVHAGEKVLLVSTPGRFNPLVAMLREGFEVAGADFLGTWSVSGSAPADWETEFTAQITSTRPADLEQLLADVDLSIMMPGANPSHAVYAAIQNVLRSGQGRAVHFHWLGAYGFDSQPIPIDDFIDEFYMHALLETDYQSLSNKQSDFEQAMRGAIIRVTTAAGTDISFRIGRRPVNFQDGNASSVRASRGVVLIDREIELPAGAIRVAPLEDSVNGKIVFPPTAWQDVKVTGLTLEFEEGIVRRVTATTGVEAVLAEMRAAGDAARAFREFALGFNPLLAIPEEGDRWIAYYGYGAGVVRLSLGDNSELGGKVGGGYVRWNFFVDATVTVDGKVWVRDGRLVL